MDFLNIEMSRSLNGKLETFRIVDGIKQGPATCRKRKEYCKNYNEEYTYVDGVKQGKGMASWEGDYSFFIEEGEHSTFIWDDKYPRLVYTYEEEYFTYVDGAKEGKGTYMYCHQDKHKAGIFWGNFEMEKEFEYKEEFTYVNGLKQGKAVAVDREGNKEEFTYVDGVREGKVIYTSSSGEKQEKLYINGLKFEDAENIATNNEGEIILVWKTGATLKATIVNGVLQGKAIYEKNSNNIEEYTYVDGVKQGKATFKSFNTEKEYFYIDGKKQGKAVHKYSEGFIGDFKEEYSYVDGVKQGKAVMYEELETIIKEKKSYFMNNKEEYSYGRNGEKEGPATTYYEDGSRRECTYYQDSIHGIVTYYRANGEIEETNYIFGESENYNYEDYYDDESPF